MPAMCSLKGFQKVEIEIEAAGVLRDPGLSTEDHRLAAEAATGVVSDRVAQNFAVVAQKQKFD